MPPKMGMWATNTVAIKATQPCYMCLSLQIVPNGLKIFTSMVSAFALFGLAVKLEQSYELRTWRNFGKGLLLQLFTSSLSNGFASRKKTVGSLNNLERNMHLIRTSA